MESTHGRPLRQCTCSTSSDRSPICPTLSCKWSCTSGRSRFAKGLGKRLNFQRPPLHDTRHQHHDKGHWHHSTSSCPLRSSFPFASTNLLMPLLMPLASPTLLMPLLMRPPLASQSQSTPRFARFEAPPQRSRSLAAGSHCRRCICTCHWGRIPRGSLPRTTASCSRRPYPRG